MKTKQQRYREVIRDLQAAIVVNGAHRSVVYAMNRVQGAYEGDK